MTSFAKHIHPERYYQQEYAKTLTKAQTEIIAPDGTRCDILTPTHAIEVDFAKKWSEAIGQSLNYALQFNRRAAILLILENEKDYKYYIRVNSIVKHFNLPIDVYITSEKALSKTVNTKTVNATSATNPKNTTSVTAPLLALRG